VATIIPIAVATDNLVGTIDEATTLDGTGSYDPGSVLIDSYEWVLLSKPPDSEATLTGPTTATPSLVPDVVGSYRVRLKVTTEDGRVSDISRTAPDSAFSHIRVGTANNGWTIPAEGERGWSNYLYSILIDADTLSGRVAELEAGSAPNSITLSYTGSAVAGELLAINSSGSLVKAKADSITTSNLIGFISSKTSTQATIVTDKIVTLSGLSAGQTYFLSPTIAGAITSATPTTVGQIVQRVGVALSTTQLLIQRTPPIQL